MIFLSSFKYSYSQISKQHGVYMCIEWPSVDKNNMAYTCVSSGLLLTKQHGVYMCIEWPSVDKKQKCL